MPVSFLEKLEDGGGTLAKWLNRFIFSPPPILKCSVMSYFILPWNDQVRLWGVVVCRKHGELSLRSKHLRRMVVKVLLLNFTKHFSISAISLLHLLTRVIVILFEWQCFMNSKYIVYIVYILYILYISFESALTIEQGYAKTGNNNNLCFIDQLT